MNRHWLRVCGLKRPVALGLCLWTALGFAAWLRADESHVVKRGETVYSIARKYGLSAAQVAERNGLSRNYHVYAGQRLLIPGTGEKPKRQRIEPAPPPAASPSPLPRATQRALEKAAVQPGRWKHIVIHHSAVDTGTMKSMDHYHREVRRMENGLAYHFVIGNGNGIGNGQIAVGHRWTEQLDGGHLASEAQNHIALGICLVGNFDEHRPTAEQMESLRALVEALLARCKLPPSAVKMHQQINVVHTRCPGAKFPAKAFLDSLNAKAAGKRARR